MSRYFYHSSISDFIHAEHDAIWGEISTNSRNDDNLAQKDSWSHEIFQLQTDLVGLDGDMIYDPEHIVLSARDREKPELTGDMWTHRSFNGGAWQNIASSLRQMYQINAYRVLLTRARQGMIICVPYGNDDKNIDGSYQDTTRLPIFYDNTYNYLKSLGRKDVDE